VSQQVCAHPFTCEHLSGARARLTCQQDYILQTPSIVV